MLLQYYKDGTFGYKGIDDCKNKLLLEQIDHEVLFEQSENEDREAFFKRVGRAPAENEYGRDKKLDMAINMHSTVVRESVAYQGYGLSKLTNDKDWEVRIIIAKQGYELDRLVNDKNEDVRATVVRIAGILGREDILEKLTNDKDPIIRAAVANYGYGLESFAEALKNEA